MKVEQNEYEIIWRCKACDKMEFNRGVIFHGKSCKDGNCKATEHQRPEASGQRR